MTRFMVVLAEQNDNGVYTDCYLEKIFEREVVPRIGESFTVGGNYYVVDGVDSDFDRDPNHDRALRICSDASEVDFRMLLESDSTWTFREGFAG